MIAHYSLLQHSHRTKTEKHTCISKSVPEWSTVKVRSGWFGTSYTTQVGLFLLQKKHCSSGSEPLVDGWWASKSTWRHFSPWPEHITICYTHYYSSLFVKHHVIVHDFVGIPVSLCLCLCLYLPVSRTVNIHLLEKEENKYISSPRKGIRTRPYQTSFMSLCFTVFQNINQ